MEKPQPSWKDGIYVHCQVSFGWARGRYQADLHCKAVKTVSPSKGAVDRTASMTYAMLRTEIAGNKQPELKMSSQWSQEDKESFNDHCFIAERFIVLNNSLGSYALSFESSLALMPFIGKKKKTLTIYAIQWKEFMFWQKMHQQVVHVLHGTFLGYSSMRP